jgi:hypothetical protein
MIRTPAIPALLILTLAFQSCFKEDRMVQPHPRGDVKTDTIAMTENYLYQVYFSLDSGRMMSSNVKTASDLGFECNSFGWHIILNTSDFMKVADMGEVPFGQPQDTTGLKWKFDKSDGNPDSNAVGQWYTLKNLDTVSNNHVYLVNRGMDELGNELGIYQVIFDSLKRGTYYFRYAPYKGGASAPGTVAKDPAFSYVYFSLKTGEVKHLEPSREGFDLLFTQYTTLLFTDAGEAYPYLVTGVLSNRYKIEVASDTLHDFSSITLDLAKSFSYTKNLDAVGYDWKYYSFSSGAYTVRPNRNYIINSASGYFYKLRFIAFYNRNGEKGYPVIEYQRL